MTLTRRSLRVDQQLQVAAHLLEVTAPVQEEPQQEVMALVEGLLPGEMEPAETLADQGLPEVEACPLVVKFRPIASVRRLKLLVEYTLVKGVSFILELRSLLKAVTSFSVIII